MLMIADLFRTIFFKMYLIFFFFTYSLISIISNVFRYFRVSDAEGMTEKTRLASATFGTPPFSPSSSPVFGKCNMLTLCVSPSIGRSSKLTV